MECFNHPGDTAVALCRGCAKGICRSCAIPVSRGLVCSEDCRIFTEALHQLQVASMRSQGVLSSTRLIQPLMALLFIGGGLYMKHSLPGDAQFMGWLLFLMGTLIGVSALLAQIKRMRSKI